MERIYVIDYSDIPEKWGKTGAELTDDEFIMVSKGWYFESWDDFVETFNENSYYSPTPDYHYIRVIKVKK